MYTLVLNVKGIMVLKVLDDQIIVKNGKRAMMVFGTLAKELLSFAIEDAKNPDIDFVANDWRNYMKAYGANKNCPCISN